MDLEQIIAARDQLWAEAVALFEGGLRWWELPADASEEQEARYIGDSWEGRLARWLEKKMPGVFVSIWSYLPRISEGAFDSSARTPETYRSGIYWGSHIRDVIAREGRP